MAKKAKKLKSERKRTVSIELDINLLSELDKRARKHHLTLREQIIDIVRRSMISYSKNKKPSSYGPEPEAMVRIFSRKKPGRKKN